MKFYKPDNLNELLGYINNLENKFYLLAGGTDINVQIKNGFINDEEIIYINHLDELRNIEDSERELKLGTLVTFAEILNSDLISNNFPFLQESLKNFASPLLQNMATIGGNIANGSPTADVLPLLLVLEAKLELVSSNSSRVVEIKDYFTGYKKTLLKSDEIIKNIILSKDKYHLFTKKLYKKVGARNALTIAKAAIACLIKTNNQVIEDFVIAAGSLNEFARRLYRVENYLIGKKFSELDYTEIETLLRKEITPISDIRSDKEYRFQVFYNLLENFLTV
ncbi:MAG: FAD binding domain-containing protein [Candidatus Cloacimonetes bacterium]|nr:FAD binding domain-containing protein [Candidatus Cloacimonadota bacterium]